ncbi:hypothetical protein ACMBCM_06585, partial [Spiroplasma sp. K1]
RVDNKKELWIFMYLVWIGRLIPPKALKSLFFFTYYYYYYYYYYFNSFYRLKVKKLFSNFINSNLFI